MPAFSPLALRAVLVTMLAPIAWGTTYIIFSEVVPAERSLLTAAWRVTPAGILLILIGATATRWRPRGVEWCHLALLSTLNFVVFFPLLILAADRLPGGVVATAGGLQPVLVTTLGALVARRSPRLAEMAVGAVAAVGVALVVLRPGAAYDTVGIAAAIGANVAFSGGVVLTRWLPAPRDPIGATGWQLLFSAAVLIPLSVAIEGVPPPLTTSTLAGFAYLSVVGTAIAFVLWFQGVRKLPATVPPLLGLAAPVTGAMVGWVVLEQGFLPSQALGFVIIVGAICFGSWTASSQAGVDRQRTWVSQAWRWGDPLHRWFYLWLAAACGGVHAAFSLYWALGGRWLLNTVGHWALAWADRAPAAAGLVLAGVTVAKLAGAVLPLAVASGRLSWSRRWRALMWAGAMGLVVYGTANAVGAWLVLAGLVTVEGARDMPALVGHAVLWDPLFAAWGVLLALGLRRLRRGGHRKVEGSPLRRSQSTETLS